MKPFFTNWKTTALGIVALLLLLLTSTGVIEQNESEQLGGLINELIEHVDKIVSVLFAIALIVSKDADKKE